MALARAVRRRGRRPARGGPGLDAAAGVAHRRGDAARAAPERPGAGGRERRYGVPDHLHHQRPGGHARPGRGRYRGTRGVAREGAGRAGAPAAVVAAARPVARARPVERREPRRDAGDLEVAARGPVDDRRDHAAQPAPERPGDGHPVTRYGGHVVNISATLAEVANSHAPSVLAALTKGGLAAATRSLAVEYASRGIRVNAVSPGIIQTPLHPAESYQDLGDQLPPLGRVGQVSDVVDAILFLESSPYITGEILHVDGGLTAGR